MCVSVSLLDYCCGYGTQAEPAPVSLCVSGTAQAPLTMVGFEGATHCHLKAEPYFQLYFPLEANKGRQSTKKRVVVEIVELQKMFQKM